MFTSRLCDPPIHYNRYGCIVCVIERCRGEISGAEVEGFAFHHSNITARVRLQYMAGVVQLVEKTLSKPHGLR
jgi:hypothetical protein